MKRLEASSLVDLQALADAQGVPLRTDVVYARDDNFLGEAIYRPDARLWLHTDLADLVLDAAWDATNHGLKFVVTDGLRTVEAQQRMINTKVAQAHPEWTVEGPKRMLSTPGTGGHPRGMAVDILLTDEDGILLDMGTRLDDMSAASARDYTKLPDEVLARRRLLEQLMQDAAEHLDLPLFMLPSEWWDYRFPAEVYEDYAPLSDADLPAIMRMCP